MTDRTATTQHGTVSIERVFDAPRSDVFRAWTDPEELASWYGPAHMDTPREQIHIDLRVGGRYELTMVRRDGAGEFSVGYEILELSEPDLLVLRSDPMPGMREASVVRVELHEEGGRTRMVLSDGPFPAEGARRAEAGWSAALDALALRVGDR